MFLETLLKFLLKKNIIVISDDSGYFMYKKLEKKVKLSSQIIDLNYLKESPFNEGNVQITSILNNDKLYLWFFKAMKYKHIIPIELLLFRSIEKKYNDTIVFFKNNNTTKLLIIKDHTLIATFNKKNISQHELLLIQNEYQVKNTHSFSALEYEEILNKSYRFFKVKDLIRILDLKFDIKSLFFNVVKGLALESLLFILIAILVVFSYKYYEESENEKLLLRYKAETKGTSLIRENIENNLNLNSKYKDIYNELPLKNKSEILFIIMKISQDYNIIIDSIEISFKGVEFVVVTKDRKLIPMYIQELFASNYFKDVKNTSSSIIRNNIIRVRMYAEIKTREE